MACCCFGVNSQNMSGVAVAGWDPWGLPVWWPLWIGIQGWCSVHHSPPPQPHTSIPSYITASHLYIIPKYHNFLFYKWGNWGGSCICHKAIESAHQAWNPDSEASLTCVDMFPSLKLSLWLWKMSSQGIITCSGNLCRQSNHTVAGFWLQEVDLYWRCILPYTQTVAFLLPAL